MTSRRTTLAIAASPFIAAVFPQFARATDESGATAQRLVGTWRSDAERTMAHWQFKETAAPEVRARIAAWFGKLTIKFTRTHVTTEFEGARFASRYHVLNSTATSITVEYFNEGKPEVEAIYLGEGFIFKRVGTSTNFEYFTSVAA